MGGNIYIRGAGGQNTNVGVTTFSGNVDINADLSTNNLFGKNRFING